MDVLGTVRVSGTDPSAGTVVPTHDRALALLTYLALAEPVGFHRRDKLIGMFWPELDTDRARHALRQTLHFLRRSLGPVLARRGDREIGIDWERFECDASGFRAAYRNGDGRRAVALYRGELLDGFGIANAPEFEWWLEDVRGQLRRQAVEVGLGLARDCAASDPGEARRLAGWVARLAPYDEAAARTAMAVLDGCGDRAAALEIYRRLELHLRSELDVEPSEATSSLADALRDRRASPGTQRDPATAPAPPDDEADEPPAAPRRWRRGPVSAVALVPVVLGLAVLLRSGGAEPMAPPGRVLWVDDNPENNTAVVGMLRATGNAVVFARSTAEALRQVDADTFDAVITDIGRYEGESFVPLAGLELLRKLREEQPGTPVLVCTSYRAAEAHRAAAIALGAREVYVECEELVPALARNAGRAAGR